MISLTLNFVSIEAARAALLEISTAHLVGGATPEREAPKGAAVQEAAPGKATAKADAAPAKTVSEKTPAAQSAVTSAPASTAATTDPKPQEGTTSLVKPSESVDYPTLQKAVFALAGKSRDAAAAVAASLGVKTFKELDADKWGEALTAVSAKMAELEAA